MAFSLTHKIALVTGGGSGIGESICKEFARAGALVYVLDLHADQARRVSEDIRDTGGQARYRQADVTQQAELVALVSGIVSEAGRVDILVNSAGIAHIGALDTTPEADFDRVYQVNVKGLYNSMFAVIPHFKNQKSGVILNMASIASMLGLPDRFAYSMSKGAVLTMTYSVARDYLKYGVRCNCIAPARVHTPFVDGFLAQNYPGKEAEMYEKLAQTQPIGRMGKPEEIAWLALYLCADESAFITGTNFPIDGGFTTLNT